MPSVDVFNEHATASAKGLNGNGPVTDTFDSELQHAANGDASNGASKISDNSDSGDPHGVSAINEMTRERSDSDGRPHTPKGSMALTDYSVNPSTPSAEKRQHIRDIVPEDFLLPNGHPDVRKTSHSN